ncbi:MAG: UDP-N-acetylmuramoyl-tripeptide--D-alanyl-D-alanine ligase [Candidatus Berkelbacteria bacterium Gr01-1014_85]|uniref:UDP-N-acetylmuramoyl-tripeptide--D-alanyl-D-alanine ligase n=1 Tax=Candidatus Berkelbacteria bacterium Gr01-1014_85 TaxID=2017150 RepID=A0A554JCF2_9BACT|nr:MAG: UDP-N-acetylmuramoyl-tripeptide--D-alanyl-D-alanine ligase [Candidatus Berkelbacteria bacterium Gr01-1014_85]
MKAIIEHWYFWSITTVAGLAIRRQRPVIIGITGSVGKTSMRVAIAHLLATAGFTVTGGGSHNLNSSLGLALASLGFDQSPAGLWGWFTAWWQAQARAWSLILGLTHLPQYLVLEYGVDRFGDMADLLKIARPTVAVMSWIGQGQHLLYLESPARIAEEKGQLLAAVPADGLVIFNRHESAQIKKILTKLAAAPIRQLESTGLAAIDEALWQIGQYFGLSNQQIRQAIKSRPAIKGRLIELAGVNRSVIIDDSYNSAFDSVKLALDYLAARPGKRHWALLGDMLEIGAAERTAHRQIIDYASSRADRLITVGRRYRQAGSRESYQSAEAAASILKNELRSGDVILIKGSQSMRMELASLALAASPTEAKAKLPRMTPSWLAKPYREP